MIVLTQDSLPKQQPLRPVHDAALHGASSPQGEAHRSETWRRLPQLRPRVCLALAGPLYYRGFDMSVPKAVLSDDSAYRFRPVRFT